MSKINITIHKIKQKLIRFVSKKSRRRLIQKMRSRLTNDNFTILCQNCVDGRFYHDCGLRFLTPTINLFFKAEDFVKLLERPHYYFSQKLEIIHTPEFSYPIGKLDDLRIHLLHFARDFRSDEECIQKWNDRVQRINWDNLFVIATDRDGMNSELMERFDKIPYKKIMYVSSPVSYNWGVFLPYFKNKPCVGVVTDLANFKGERFYETNIDLVSWINGK